VVIASTANAPALIFLTRAATARVLSANKAIIECTAAALIVARPLDQAAVIELLDGVACPFPSLGASVLAMIPETIESAGADVRAMMDWMTREPWQFRLEKGEAQ
jgi:hypothetical protein